MELLLIVIGIAIGIWFLSRIGGSSTEESWDEELGDCELCGREDVKLQTCSECGREFCIRCGYWPRGELADEKEPICHECIDELRG